MSNRFFKKVFCILVLFTLISIGIFRVDFDTSIVIFDQDEVEINFDSGIASHYFQTNFDAFTFSERQIMEYLNWNNQNACREYQDFGGAFHTNTKVRF